MPAKHCRHLFIVLLAAIVPWAAAAVDKPAPTETAVSYGSHPNQLLDLYLPKDAAAKPYPVLIWYGGIWKASRGAPDPNRFTSKGIAVIAAGTRTMEDAVHDKASPPVAYVMEDACRVVQFVRLNAAKWNLDGERIAVGGGSQGTLPALYVGCSADHAEPRAEDPVNRVSTRVTCIAAFRSQPSIDPKRMQEWVPGVQWGAPALGCSFEESLKRRDELLPIIRRYSPETLLRADGPPVYFENEWGMTQPADVTENNYKVHSPAWAAGFQKMAKAAGVRCLIKYPGHPTDAEGYADIWDFIIKSLKQPKA